MKYIDADKLITEIDSIWRHYIESDEYDNGFNDALDKVKDFIVSFKLNQDMGEISDGYHTFNELYYYRMLYNAAFFNLLPKEWVHKSKRHHTGEECFGGGWFIVMANLPTGQISNHYELKDWDLFKIPEKEIADEWDGHTPQEAAERLHKYLQQEQPDPRHSLIEFIKWACDRGSITPEQRKNVDFWLAYLEKQKEQKPAKDTALQEAFINSKIDYTLEEKCDASDYAEIILPTSVIYGENEEEYKLHKIIEAAFIAGQKKEQKSPEWNEDEKERIRQNCRLDVCYNPEKYGLCHKIEWCEEDEKMLEIAEECATNKDFVFETTEEQLSFLDWLNSLPKRFELQPKQEWSGGEMKVLNSIIDDYEKTSKSFCGYDGKIGLLKAIRDGEYNLPNPVEWSEEDEKPFNDVLSGLKYAYEDLINNKSLDSAKDIKEAFDWMQARVKNFRPQPKQEWSEEDKERLEAIIAYLTFENENRGFIGQDRFTAGDLIHWLKSLHERLVIQPKKEWSEEDEKVYSRLLNHYENLTHCITTADRHQEIREELNFLNSLRPQPHWKPSAEQMNALENSIAYCDEKYYNTLDSLYNDLQKLL